METTIKFYKDYNYQNKEYTFVKVEVLEYSATGKTAKVRFLECGYRDYAQTVKTVHTKSIRDTRDGFNNPNITYNY